MNRIQFWILTGLSGLLFLLLITHVIVVKLAIQGQNRVALAQQEINQAQAFGGNMKQLALRIIQVSQQSGDQGLKDLLVRQEIKFTPNTPSADATNGASSTPPAATH